MARELAREQPDVVLPEVPDFDPGPLLRQPDLQTIIPALAPYPPVGGETSELVVPFDDDGRAVLVLVNRPERAAPRGTLLLAHGLGGEADSAYMCWTGREARERGWVVARMNLRGCGGTERLSRSLHNSAQSDDVHRVLAALGSAGFPRPVAAVGFSLGASLVLREAALSGDGAPADVFVGVNPPVDLALSARRMEHPRNLLYRAYFMLRLCRMLEEARRIFPVPGPPARPWRVRSIRRFDDLYTAPFAGFRDAEDYYRQSSVKGVLHRIRRPALVLSSRDAPLVPAASFDGIPERSGTVLCRLVSHGGHVGYRQRGPRKFWAAMAVLDWIEAVTD